MKLFEQFHLSGMVALLASGYVVQTTGNWHGAFAVAGSIYSLSKYVALTNSWVDGAVFTPAEQAAMQRGKTWIDSSRG